MKLLFAQPKFSSLNGKFLDSGFSILSIFFLSVILAACSPTPPSATGQPWLEMLDDQGTARAQLMLGDDESPWLHLAHADDTVRMGLRVLADGSPGLDLLDSLGTLRSTLEINGSEDTVHVLLCDAGGTERGGLGLTEVGNPWLELADGSGATRLKVDIGDDGTIENGEMLQSMLHRNPARGEPPTFKVHFRKPGKFCVHVNLSVGNQDNKLLIHLDGKQVAGKGFAFGPRAVFIGDRPEGNFIACGRNREAFFKGRMDHFRIYRKVHDDFGAVGSPPGALIQETDFHRSLKYHTTADWDHRTQGEREGKVPPEGKVWLKRVRGY